MAALTSAVPRLVRVMNPLLVVALVELLLEVDEVAWCGNRALEMRGPGLLAYVEGSTRRGTDVSS